jgi:hypothetical protein
MPRRPGAWWRGLLAVLPLAGLLGCAGGGHVEVAALNYREIDPPPARIARLSLDHCYWWTDDTGQVWVAMEATRRPLLGALGPFSFRLSLALEKLPAGKDRNYLVARRELRAVARFGVSEGRFVSTMGIVALYRDKGERLRGTFRLLTQRQVTGLLGGWGRPSNHLLLGSFTAVHDPVRGAEIATATESQGWDREEPPASQDAEGVPLHSD